MKNLYNLFYSKLTVEFFVTFNILIILFGYKILGKLFFVAGDWYTHLAFVFTLGVICRNIQIALNYTFMSNNDDFKKYYFKNALSSLILYFTTISFLCLLAFYGLDIDAFIDGITLFYISLRMMFKLDVFILPHPHTYTYTYLKKNNLGDSSSSNSGSSSTRGGRGDGHNGGTREGDSSSGTRGALSSSSRSNPSTSASGRGQISPSTTRHHRLTVPRDGDRRSTYVGINTRSRYEPTTSPILSRINPQVFSRNPIQSNLSQQTFTGNFLEGNVNPQTFTYNTAHNFINNQVITANPTQGFVSQQVFSENPMQSGINIQVPFTYPSQGGVNPQMSFAYPTQSVVNPQIPSTYSSQSTINQYEYPITPAQSNINPQEYTIPLVQSRINPYGFMQSDVTQYSTPTAPTSNNTNPQMALTYPTQSVVNPQMPLPLAGINPQNYYTPLTQIDINPQNYSMLHMGGGINQYGLILPQQDVINSYDTPVPTVEGIVNPYGTTPVEVPLQNTDTNITSSLIESTNSRPSNVSSRVTILSSLEESLKPTPGLEIWDKMDETASKSHDPRFHDQWLERYNSKKDEILAKHPNTKKASLAKQSSEAALKYLHKIINAEADALYQYRKNLTPEMTPPFVTFVSQMFLGTHNINMDPIPRDYTHVYPTSITFTVENTEFTVNYHIDDKGYILEPRGAAERESHKAGVEYHKFRKINPVKP